MYVHVLFIKQNYDKSLFFSSASQGRIIRSATLLKMAVKRNRRVKFLPREKNISSLGGLEPPTFRLTAERANRLRHRDFTSAHIFNLNRKICNIKL